MLQKIIRDFYDKKHEQVPDATFESCFPDKGGKVVWAERRFVRFGLAASVLLVVAALLMFQVYDSPTDGQMTALQQNLRNSDVLGLSPVQADTLARELAHFTAAPDARLKEELLARLLDDRDLSLSNIQAVAITGLVGHWNASEVSGANDPTWMDDAQLRTFMADCSTHCHGPAGIESLDRSYLSDYLLECIGTRSAVRGAMKCGFVNTFPVVPGGGVNESLLQ